MTASTPVIVRSIDIADGEIDVVFRLYRKHTGTLGFLPKGAFDQLAEQGRILGAFTGQQLEGYLAYRVAKSDAVIVHLCVRKDARGRGVASALLGELFRQTAGLNKIRLSCREEYAANKLWPRHNFICDNERKGRGADGAMLLLWSRKQAGETPPLLAIIRDAQREGKQIVVVDANVFFDFYSNEPRSNESKGLLADWLEPDVLVSVTAELKNEITRRTDREQRHEARNRVGSFHLLEGLPAEVDQALERIGQVLPVPVSESDLSDRRQLAHAAAEHANYFVTRDGVLLQHANALELATNVIVVRPADFVIRLHEQGSQEQYTPARLVGTTISRRRPRKDAELAPFQRFRQRESKASWLTLVRPVLVDPVRFETFVVEPPDTGPILLVSLSPWTRRTRTSSLFRSSEG